MPGEGNHYCWKVKIQTKANTISQKYSRKTASHTWNVTKMGFRLKHGKTLTSVTARTLDSPQSLVSGGAKRKSDELMGGGGEGSFKKNSLLKRKKLNIHVSYLQAPPAPAATTTILLNIMLHILFCFQVTFPEKVFFFFFFSFVSDNLSSSW